MNQGRKKPDDGCSDNRCRDIRIDDAELRVPVRLLPRARVCRVETECSGLPCVHLNGECGVIVSQRLKLRITLCCEVDAAARSGSIDTDIIN